MKKHLFSLLLALSLPFILFSQGKLQQGSIIGVDGVKIEYLDCGSAEASLLFVHGWNIKKEYWKSQLDYFCPGYRVVAIGLPGFWAPSGKREVWTVEKFGADVVALIDSLSLQKAILIGHSMGGDIMLEAARQKPEAVIGMVGIDNFKDVKPSTPEEEKAAIAAFMEMLEADYANTVAAYTEQMLFSSETDSLDRSRVLEDYRNARPEAAISSLRSLIDYSPREVECLQQLPHKLYLINSDYMPTDESALEKYCVAGYEVLPIPGTGHFPMIEKPGLFNQQLEVAIGKILGR